MNVQPGKKNMKDESEYTEQTDANDSFLNLKWFVKGP